MPALGALWGLALLGMLIAAAGVALGHPWWRPVAVAASAASSVAVLVWWQDAKFGMVANAVVLAAVLAAPRLSDVAH